MEIKKEIENFDLDKVKSLSQIEARHYVDKYLIPLTNGEYQIIDDAVIKKTYFKKMSVELNTYYFKEKTDTISKE